MNNVFLYNINTSKYRFVVTKGKCFVQGKSAKGKHLGKELCTSRAQRGESFTLMGSKAQLLLQLCLPDAISRQDSS